MPVIRSANASAPPVSTRSYAAHVDDESHDLAFARRRPTRPRAHRRRCRHADHHDRSRHRGAAQLLRAGDAEGAQGRRRRGAVERGRHACPLRRRRAEADPARRARLRLTDRPHSRGSHDGYTPTPASRRAQVPAQRPAQRDAARGHRRRARAGSTTSGWSSSRSRTSTSTTSSTAPSSTSTRWPASPATRRSSRCSSSTGAGCRRRSTGRSGRRRRRCSTSAPDEVIRAAERIDEILRATASSTARPVPRPRRVARTTMTAGAVLGRESEAAQTGGGAVEPAMARRRPPTVHGVAVVDKPAGVTSHDVVAQLRRRFDERRIGHAGTLDPGATGVLVVGVGMVTRLLRFITEGRKRYTGEIVLGVETDTLDADGEVTATHDAAPVDLDRARARDRRAPARRHRTGPADGVGAEGRRPAVARVGPRGQSRSSGRRGRCASTASTSSASRRVPPAGRCCTSRSTVVPGTYVRALAADLGRLLGTGAHLRNLRRTAVEPFTIDEAAPPESCVLLPPIEAVRALAKVTVDDDDARRDRRRQATARASRRRPVGDGHRRRHACWRSTSRSARAPPNRRSCSATPG